MIDQTDVRKRIRMLDIPRELRPEPKTEVTTKHSKNTKGRIENIFTGRIIPTTETTTDFPARHSAATKY